MKRLIPLFLVLCLTLCACGQGAATEPPTEVPTTVPATEAPTEPPTEEPTEPPTEPPTEAPTEPPVLYRHPLTGEPLDAPCDDRIFAITINNVPQAMPHYGISQADVYFEMLVNGGAIRGLAFFTDPQELTQIGSCRSARYNFVDMCQAYDAVLVYSGASNEVLNDIWYSDIDNLTDYGYDCFYRDYGRYESYAWEHCLFIDGSKLESSAASAGIRTTMDQEKDYGFRFTEDYRAVGGRVCTEIEIDYWSNDAYMAYDAGTGMYDYSLFGNDSWDEATDTPVSFKNVFLLYMNVYNSGEYHISDVIGSGDGYYACNGRIIPIKWIHENTYDPFTFTLEDGTPLEQSVGNSYIGFVPYEYPIRVY